MLGDVHISKIYIYKFDNLSKAVEILETISGHGIKSNLAKSINDYILVSKYLTQIALITFCHPGLVYTFESHDYSGGLVPSSYLLRFTIIDVFNPCSARKHL